MPVPQEMNFLVEQASFLFLNKNGATFQLKGSASINLPYSGDGEGVSASSGKGISTGVDSGDGKGLSAPGEGISAGVDSGDGDGLSAPGEGISAGVDSGDGGTGTCSGSAWGLWRLRTHKPKPPKANISPNSPSRGSGNLDRRCSTGSGAGEVSGYSNCLEDSESLDSGRSPDFWRDRGRDGGSDTEADTGADACAEACAEATSGSNSTNLSGDIRQ